MRIHDVGLVERGTIKAGAEQGALLLRANLVFRGLVVGLSAIPASLALGISLVNPLALRLFIF